MPAVFDEILMDPNYSAVASGGAEWLTAIITAPSGLKQRNVSRQDPIRKYTINFDLLSSDQLADLNIFFIARFGMARGFRFLAPLDRIATNEKIAITDGATTVFRLVKAYGNYTRRIVKPEMYQVNLALDGAPVLLSGDLIGEPLAGESLMGGPEAAATVDYTTGTVTFVTAPAAGKLLTWSGVFDTPVCFGADFFNPQLDSGGASSWGIDVVEILPIELGLT